MVDVLHSFVFVSSLSILPFVDSCIRLVNENTSNEAHLDFSKACCKFLNGGAVNNVTCMLLLREFQAS